MAREYNYDGCTIVVHANSDPHSYHGALLVRGAITVTCPHCHSMTVNLGRPEINSITSAECQSCGRVLAGFVAQSNDKMQQTLQLRGGALTGEGHEEDNVILVAVPEIHQEFAAFLASSGWRAGASPRWPGIEWQCLTCGTVNTKRDYREIDFTCPKCSAFFSNSDYGTTVMMAKKRGRNIVFGRPGNAGHGGAHAWTPISPEKAVGFSFDFASGKPVGDGTFTVFETKPIGYRKRDGEEEG